MAMTTPAARTPAPHSPPGLLLLRAVYRHWPLVLLIGLPLAAIAAVAAWVIVPPAPPQVRAMLHIASDKPSILFKVGDGAGNLDAFRQTQATLMKSRLVLNAALRQPDVNGTETIRRETDPIAWLDKFLRIHSVGSPEIMAVTLAGDRPDDLKIIVNAVTKAYLQEVVNKQKMDRQARLDELKQVQGRYEDLLRRKRKALRDLVESVGTNDKEAMAIKQRLSQEQLAAVTRELMEVKTNIRRLKVEQTAAPNQGGQVAVPRTQYEEFLAADPIIARKMLEKRQLEELIDITLPQAARGKEEPVIQGYQRQLEQIHESMKEREQFLRPAFEQRLAESLKAQSQSQAKAVQDRERYLTQLEKALEVDVNRLIAEGQSLNQGALDIESFRIDITQAETMAQQAASEAEKLSVELRAPERISLLEEAVQLSIDPVGRKMQMAGLASVGSLGLVAGLIGLWEMRKRRVYSSEQMDDLGVPLLGSVPAPLGKERQAVWEQVRLESVDAITAMLFSPANGQALKAVLITSACSGEGKTSLAVQLAQSLARSGRRTVLIDTDLRRPAVGRLLDMPAGAGVCELLRGETTLASAIGESPVTNLWVLSAGCRSCGELDNLAAGRLGPVIEQVKAEFDVAVIDSCPLLPVSDTLHVARHADVAVLSIMQDVSRMPQIEAARKRLRALGLPVVGAVVNGVRQNMAEYGYSYVSQGRQAAPQEVTV